MDFPRLVYKNADTYKLVIHEDEFDAAIADGWYENVPDAIAKKPRETVANAHAPESVPEQPEESPEEESEAPPTRKELEQKAVELGIKFDGRTRDVKLAALIAEKLEG